MHRLGTKAWHTTGRRPIGSSLKAQADCPGRGLATLGLDAATEPGIRREHVLFMYRVLLREASYLPDLHCRLHARECIQRRFRASNIGVTLMRNGSLVDPVEKLKVTDTTRRIEEFKTQWRKLRLANDGDQIQLRRLLREVYSRTGRQRRKILAQMAPSTDTGNADRPPTLSPLFISFAKSQIRNQPSEGRQKKLRTLNNLDVDKTYQEQSVWGKPISRIRAHRKLHRAVADTLDRIITPLPRDQWNFLRSIVVDNKDVPAVPAPRAGSRWHKSSTSHIVTRNLPSRALRHLYSSLFSQCSYMTWDAVSNQCKVEWGHKLISGRNRSSAGWAGESGTRSSVHSGIIDPNLSAGMSESSVSSGALLARMTPRETGLDGMDELWSRLSIGEDAEAEKRSFSAR